MSIKTIEYIGELFRADEDIGKNPIGETAVNHYPANYTHQFFTLTNAETSSYRKKGVRYTKTWEVNQATPLLLLDMLDLATRNWVLHTIKNSKKYLNTAFPVIKNKVYRFSNTNTVSDDRAILNIICGLTTPDGRAIDGYYMERQVNVPLHSNTQRSFNNAISPFHSEIGLCRSAFHKIRLINIKTTREIPNIPNKRRTSKRRNNNRRPRNRSQSPRRAAPASASVLSFNSPPHAATASALRFSLSSNAYDSPPSTRKLFTHVLDSGTDSS
jgi:hypothetical protein